MKKILLIVIIILLVLLLLPIYNKHNISYEKISNNYDIYKLKGKTNNNVDIFNSSKNDVIAPGSTGIYHFNVQNNTKDLLEYNLSFKEDNKYNINIKYRIKLNDKPITNDWSYLKDIKLKKNKLESYKYDLYELEWKWFDSDNDSNIEEDSFYKLNIITKSNGVKKK